VRNKSVWERACGLTRSVVEGVEFDEMVQAIWRAVRHQFEVGDRRCERSPRAVWISDPFTATAPH